MPQLLPEINKILMKKKNLFNEERSFWFSMHDSYHCKNHF